MWAILSSLGTALCLALGRGCQNGVHLDAGGSTMVGSEAEVPGGIRLPACAGSNLTEAAVGWGWRTKDPRDVFRWGNDDLTTVRVAGSFPVVAVSRLSCAVLELSPTALGRGSWGNDGLDVSVCESNG